jgi:hypothetical protein
VTEAEWLGCTDLKKLLAFLEGKTSDRKLRLFAVACCRRIWDTLRAFCRETVEVAEKYADEIASPQLLYDYHTYGVALGLSNVARATVAPDADSAASRAAVFAARVTGGVGKFDAESVAQAALLRDIIGDPFRPATTNPAWLAWNGGAVAKPAQAAYDQRLLPSGELDPARLAVLADALEEVGCSVPDILDHLRGPGPHVRGCWAVDLLLGKA